MLEASAFQALQAQAPYRGIIKPPVELVVHDLEEYIKVEVALIISNRLDVAGTGEGR